MSRWTEEAMSRCAVLIAIDRQEREALLHEDHCICEKCCEGMIELWERMRTIMREKEAADDVHP